MSFLPISYKFAFLTSVSSGLTVEEDAPDIIANTFLPDVTDEEITNIGYGFLRHRERKFITLFSE